MVKHAIMSKAAKLIAACVCPAVLTLTVPPVRDAVHKATAPRAVANAKPKVRRAAVSREPRAATQALPPAQTSAVMLTCPQYTGIGSLPDLATTPLPAATRAFAHSLALPVAGLTGGGADAPPSGLRPLPPGIPEPETWVTLVIGFAGVGIALRRPRAADARTTPQ